MLKIDGTAVPAPSEMEVSINEMAATPERNAAGGAVMDFRGTKRTLKLRWAHLTGGQLASLLQATSGRFFNATYPDPMTGGEKTIACYCMGQTMGMLRMRDGSQVWTEIEMEWNER